MSHRLNVATTPRWNNAKIREVCTQELKRILKACSSGSGVVMRYSGKLKSLRFRMRSRMRDSWPSHGLDQTKPELEVRSPPQFFPAPGKSVRRCLTFVRCLQPCNVATEPPHFRVVERHCRLSRDRPFAVRLPISCNHEPAAYPSRSQRSKSN